MSLQRRHGHGRLRLRNDVARPSIRRTTIIVGLAACVNLGLASSGALGQDADDRFEIPSGSSIQVTGDHVFVVSPDAPARALDVRAARLSVDRRRAALTESTTRSRFYVADPSAPASRVWDRIVIVGSPMDDGDFEPWALSSGSTQPVLLVDIAPGPLPCDAGAVTICGERMVFAADDSIEPGARYGSSSYWATDGTPAGSRRIASSSGFAAEWIAASGGTAVGAFGRIGIDGRTVIVTDGTPEGTAFDSVDRVDIGPVSFASDGFWCGRPLFPGANFVLPSIVRYSGDGRPGERIELAAAAASDVPRSVLSLGTVVLFDAWDDVAGLELRAADGVSPPVLLIDAVAGPDGGSVADLQSVLERAVFTTRTSSGLRALWGTDGTPGGTAQLAPATGDATVVRVVGTNESGCYFTLEAQGAETLWVTDGTIPGTRAVVSARDGTPEAPTAYRLDRSTLWFAASDEAHGLEPWFSDGTPKGTCRAADVWPGPHGSGPRFPKGEAGFVEAASPGRGRELWRLDRGRARRGPDLSPGLRDSEILWVHGAAGGANVIHAIADVGGETQELVAVKAWPRLRGYAGIDSDADGFADDVERLLGTSVSDEHSTPIADRVTVAGRPEYASAEFRTAPDHSTVVVIVIQVPAPLSAAVGEIGVTCDVGGAVAACRFHEGESTVDARFGSFERSFDAGSGVLSIVGSFSVVRDDVPRAGSRRTMTFTVGSKRFQATAQARSLRHRVLNVIRLVTGSRVR